MTLETRPLTGLPSWPITLLAGVKDAGKTYLSVEASASPLIARTFWLAHGELEPDEYGWIPGSSVDVVQHDGTRAGIVRTVNEIADLPVPEDGVTLIVIDSGTPIWETLSAGVNAAKIARGPRAEGDKDLWDAARAEWNELLTALRRNQGPSIITARLEDAPVYVDDKPTGERVWRVRAERDLPFEVGVCIEMRQRGDYLITGMKSARAQFTRPELREELTMDGLWRELGLAGPVGPASFARVAAAQAVNLDRSERNWLAELEKAVSHRQVVMLGAEAQAAKASDEVMLAIRVKSRRLAPKPPTGTPPAAQ